METVGLAEPRPGGTLSHYFSALRLNHNVPENRTVGI